MHELSIAMSILDVAEEEAERQGGARVVAVHLKLGPLSGVVQARCGRPTISLAKDTPSRGPS